MMARMEQRGALQIFVANRKNKKGGHAPTFKSQAILSGYICLKSYHLNVLRIQVV
ncbi:MAG: hypothetical protein NEHIOOID_01289 [Holosporales bacterium]